MERQDSIPSATSEKNSAAGPPATTCENQFPIANAGKKKKKGPPNRSYERLLYGKYEGQVDPDSCRNASLEKYYRAQSIVGESEMDSLLDCMRTSLPATVRLSKLRPEWPAAKSRLEAQAEWCPISWYPDTAMAWRCSSDDYHHPSHAAFREWVKEANSAGSLTFQEEVSMVPPLLLDLQPDSCVLDMCSAPGSKTLGIIEIMNRGLAGEGEAGDANPASFAPSAPGMIVANDSDSKRVNNIMLPRLLRLRSPSLAISVANGAKFPLLSPVGDPSGLSRSLFDRILVDAPCSGDGTIRKDPSVWRRWTVRDGLELHPAQVRLLCRALSLLRVGGRVVYSTCSLNPIENEAVVSAALSKFGPAVALLDCSKHMPAGLKARAGLTSWQVPDPQACDDGDVRWLAPGDAVSSNAHDKTSVRSKVRVKASMFPPETGSKTSHTAAELRKCIRILPCDNDAGGFFCAIIIKTATTADVWSKSPAGDNADESDPISSGAETAIGKCGMEGSSGCGNGIGRAAQTENDVHEKDLPVSGDTFHANSEYHDLRQNETEMLELEKFYGLGCDDRNLGCGAGALPADLRTRQGWQHHDSPERSIEASSHGQQLRLISIGSSRIAAVSPEVHRWLGALGQARSRMKFKQLQLASFGVRIFQRLREGFGLSAGCRWRPCQQGVELLASLCTRRKLQLMPKAFLSLLEVQQFPMQDLLKLDAAGGLEGWDTVAHEQGAAACPSLHTASDEQLSTGFPPANRRHYSFRTDDRMAPNFGGVMVGLHSSVRHPSRLWVSAVLNEQGLTTFASRAELASAKASLKESDLLDSPTQ